jgi:hypothetical protein
MENFMGYGLMAYSINFEEVTALYASGNDKIRRAISGRFKDRIASSNEQLEYSKNGINLRFSRLSVT